MAPAISVVIPAFNVEAYLRRSVESVMQQSFKNIEIIIVDDASADGTGRIGAMLAQEDDRVRVWTQPENRGLGEARNAGTIQAQGKYIFYLDSDDWIECETLQTMYELAEKEQADVVACGVRYAYEDGSFAPYHGENLRTTGGKAALEQLAEYRIGTIAWNKLYQTALIKENGICFLPIYHEDVSFSIEIAYFCQKYISVDTVFCNYFQRKNSISNKKIAEKHFTGYFEIIRFIKEFFAVHAAGSAEETLQLQRKLWHSQMQWIIPNVLQYLEQSGQAESQAAFARLCPAYFGSNHYFVESFLDYIQWYLYRKEPLTRSGSESWLKKLRRQSLKKLFWYLLPYGIIKLLHKER